MIYSVTGVYGTSEATVTWVDGVLRGGRPGQAPTGWDIAALAAIELKALRLEGREVGPIPGPYTTADHIDDPLSALFVMREVFEVIVSTRGDVPEAPQPGGPGAVH